MPLDDWLKWHDDEKGFDYPFTLSLSGLILLRLRIIKDKLIRFQLLLFPKRSKIGGNHTSYKILLEESLPVNDVKRLTYAINELISFSSKPYTIKIIPQELEKIIIQLNLLKKFVKEVIDLE